MSKSKIGSLTLCIGTGVSLKYSITRHCPTFTHGHPCLYAQNTTYCIVINWYYQQPMMANLFRTHIVTCFTGTWPTQSIASLPAPTSEVNGTHHYFVVKLQTVTTKLILTERITINFLSVLTICTLILWVVLCSDLEVCECGFSNVQINGTVLKEELLNFIFLIVLFFPSPWALQPLCHYTWENYSFTTKLYTSAVFWRTDSCFTGG